MTMYCNGKYLVIDCWVGIKYSISSFGITDAVKANLKVLGLRAVVKNVCCVPDSQLDASGFDSYWDKKILSGLRHNLSISLPLS